MRKLLTTAVLIMAIMGIFAESPIVTNVTASQRTDGNEILSFVIYHSQFKI
ncbi:MAG: hypothetical protein U9N34_07175 [Candidatus Cloacimonadota bacterium]|nr:hypothetical protein [Candidatus Cloacimonadota bacterium]